MTIREFFWSVIQAIKSFSWIVYHFPLLASLMAVDPRFTIYDLRFTIHDLLFTACVNNSTNSSLVREILPDPFVEDFS
jgi:hypothetical protein